MNISERWRRHRAPRVGKFRIGDRVEVHALTYLGLGTIIDISRDIKRGRGTKLYPSILVALDDGPEHWLKGISLTRVEKKR